jgi:hypothetical protein
MDGLAKYDWRELRKKTLQEIAAHRGQKISKRRTTKQTRKIHLQKSGHSVCDMGWKGLIDLTLDENEVTCYYCQKVLGQMHVID